MSSYFLTDEEYQLRDHWKSLLARDKYLNYREFRIIQDTFNHFNLASYEQFVIEILGYESIEHYEKTLR